MTSASLLNLDKINELKEILEDELFDLFIEFKSGTKIIIDDFKIEYEKNNTEALIKLAHLLKGSSGNLGLSRIYQLMMKLESNLREENDCDISALMTEVESAYHETLKELIANGYLKE